MMSKARTRRALKSGFPYPNIHRVSHFHKPNHSKNNNANPRPPVSPLPFRAPFTLCHVSPLSFYAPFFHPVPCSFYSFDCARVQRVLLQAMHPLCRPPSDVPATLLLLLSILRRSAAVMTGFPAPRSIATTTSPSSRSLAQLADPSQLAR